MLERGDRVKAQVIISQQNAHEPRHD
jgi:hypothetical protein